MTINQKIQSIENNIAELTARLQDKKNSKARRLDYIRSRAAYRASLTRLINQLKATDKPAMEVVNKGERVYQIEIEVPDKVKVEPKPDSTGTAAAVANGLIDADREENVVIKSAVTAAQLGWSAPNVDRTKKLFSPSKYADVLVVHSRTNFTS